MKKIMIAVVTMMTLATTVTGQTHEKPYSFKSAHVEYEITGNTTGTQTLYIDDWGWSHSETTHSVTKMLGQKTETHERKITKKLDTWQWVPGEKTGSKVHNKMLEELLADPDFDMNKFAQETMKSLGFEKTGNETVNGKNCDVYKGMLGSTIWHWNNIAVKTEVKLMGTKYVMTATKIELDVDVPAEQFSIPGDVKFTETVFSPDEMMMQGAQEDETDDSGDKPAIKSLKDLKGLFGK